MKTTLRNLALALVTVLTFSSCDDILNPDIKFDTSFDVVLDVVATPGKGVFSVTDTINILEHPQLIQYTGMIQNIDIQTVEIEVLSLTPDTIVLSTCNMSASAGTLPTAAWSFTNESLHLGRIINMDNSTNQFTNAKNVFMSQLPIAVNLNGIVDADNATFQVKVTFNSEVTVSPLGN
ncbi:MAG TPA: hypothetical protein PLM70_08000 [Bacteroidales bacterium]|nr:hypothetical protein [Bacteroidales bacterium]